MSSQEDVIQKDGLREVTALGCFKWDQLNYVIQTARGFLKSKAVKRTDLQVKSNDILRG